MTRSSLTVLLSRYRSKRVDTNASEPGTGGAAQQMPFAGGSGRLDAGFCVLVFVAMLAAHFYFATINWKYGFMPGHEFRQAQTALITYYIDHENNFSPFYNQPLFGKPWSVQLEFPLYQWGVTWLSRATHWPYFISARTLSLTSFYLTLPALFLALGRFGLPGARRLLVLALLLVTPVHLFYARAFLIDPMALMLSAWFFALFIETMERRRCSLLVLTGVCGAAAALIKSLVFFAWAFPAAIYGAWKLWRILTERQGGAELARTAAWGLATVILPIAALAWWVPATDVLKEAHPTAYFLSSHNLSHGNYGTFSLGSRLSTTTWRELLARWDEAVAAPWAMMVLLGVGVIFFTKERWRVLAAAGLFLVPQLAIPYAYSGQDYYFYTCAAFIVIAFGFVANGMLDLPWPRFVRWVLVLVPLVPLADAYRRTYYRWQSVQSHGGTQMAFALRDVLPSDTVIVVAGMDWAAMLPYYAQHRALMLRNGLEGDAAHLDRAFQALSEDDVSALVLVGDQRKNKLLIQRAAEAFGTDTEISFSDDSTDVYLNRFYAGAILGSRLPPNNVFGLKLGAGQTMSRNLVRAKPLRATLKAAFPMVDPVPTEFQSRFGYGVWPGPDGVVLNAHPDVDLWVPVSADKTEVEWEFGILNEAWDRPGGEGTNGVEFIVEIEDAKGKLRSVFHRLLAPKTVQKDRGLQRETIRFRAEAGDRLVFRTRPHEENYAFDWAYWRKIKVR